MYFSDVMRKPAIQVLSGNYIDRLVTEPIAGFKTKIMLLGLTRPKGL